MVPIVLLKILVAIILAYLLHFFYKEKVHGAKIFFGEDFEIAYRETRAKIFFRLIEFAGWFMVYFGISTALFFVPIEEIGVTKGSVIGLFILVMGANLIEVPVDHAEKNVIASYVDL